MIAPVLVGVLGLGPSPPVNVTAHQCGTLDADEVSRLLMVELDPVVDENRGGPPLTVTLSCSSEILAIAVTDPVTGKRMARDVPAPADVPGRERVVALAVAQLFTASWLELLTPAPPEAQAPVPPRPPAPTIADETIAAARALARARVRPRSRSIALAVGTAVRGRALERAPFAVGAATVELRAYLGDVGLLVRGGFDGGVARRSLGDVSALLITAGLGVIGRVALTRRWSFGGWTAASAAWGRVAAKARAPGIRAASSSAASGELAVGLGPCYGGDRIGVELDVELGATLRPPEGLVDRERSVTSGGVWTGLALRLAVAWPLAQGAGR